jgi:OOP family OmpA-OmpF porin
LKGTRWIALGLALVFGSACASTGPNPWICAAVGAGLGAGGGALVGAKSTRGSDGDEMAIGGGIGAVAGGGLGYLICALMQKEEAPPPKKAEPAPPPPAPRAERIVLRGVNFDFDKSNIRPDARVILDEAASQLGKNPNVNVSVEGQTDSVGTDAYNQKLSERRAAAVKEYLAGKGVSSGRLTTVGHGESKPIASNSTKDGRALNRRVELLVK